MGIGQVRQTEPVPTRDLFEAGQATRTTYITCPTCKGTGDRPEEKP